MAASLAGPDGHLTLLAVTAVSGSGAYATAAISPGRVDLVLSNAKRIADDAGVPSSTVVDPDGPPVEVILERASDHDLLAIGAPATSWLGGMLIGGVATTALSRFTTPDALRSPLVRRLAARAARSWSPATARRAQITSWISRGDSDRARAHRSPS